MGGGKTHNLLALALLARHPELREPVMGGFHKPGPAVPDGRQRGASWHCRIKGRPLDIAVQARDDGGQRPWKKK